MRLLGPLSLIWPALHTLISEMVSLIPRLSSFAVSGTPARTRVSDLSYVLKLRVQWLLAC